MTPTLNKIILGICFQGSFITFRPSLLPCWCCAVPVLPRAGYSGARGHIARVNREYFKNNEEELIRMKCFLIWWCFFRDFLDQFISKCGRGCFAKCCYISFTWLLWQFSSKSKTLLHVSEVSLSPPCCTPVAMRLILSRWIFTVQSVNWILWGSNLKLSI